MINPNPIKKLTFTLDEEATRVLHEAVNSARPCKSEDKNQCDVNTQAYKTLERVFYSLKGADELLLISGFNNEHLGKINFVCLYDLWINYDNRCYKPVGVYRGRVE